MDAIVLLKEDHKVVKDLFKEFEKIKDSTTPAAKKKVVGKICTEMVTHSFIEETIF
jgi:hypothetical protein